MSGIFRGCAIIVVFVLHTSFAYSASTFFPAPIKNSDLESYSELLVLSDSQYIAIYDLYTEYTISYKAMITKESLIFSNDYPHFLTLSYNISSNNPVDSRSLRDYRRIYNKILIQDNSLFDNMATLLSREQLQRMHKIRNSRERSRYIHLLRYSAFSNMSQIDLTTIYSALTLSPEERVAADPLINDYEARLRQLLKSASSSALRLRSEISRKIVKLSLSNSPDSIDDTIRVIKGIWYGELVEFDDMIHKIGLLHWRYQQLLDKQLKRDNIDILNEYYFSAAYPNINNLGVKRIISILDKYENNADVTMVDAKTIVNIREEYNSKVYPLISELVGCEIERVRTNLSGSNNNADLENNDNKARRLIDMIAEETAFVLRSLSELDKRTELIIEGIRKNSTVSLDREKMEHQIITTFKIEKGGRKSISYAYIDGVLASEYRNIGQAVIRLYRSRIRLTQQELYAIYNALEIDHDLWMAANLIYEDYVNQIDKTCGTIDIFQERANENDIVKNELMQADRQIAMIRSVVKEISRHSTEYISNVAILSNVNESNENRRISIVTEYIKSRVFITMAKCLEKYIRFIGRNIGNLRHLEGNGYEMCTDVLWLYGEYQSRLSKIPSELDVTCESSNMIVRYAENIMEQDIAMLLFQSRIIDKGMHDTKSSRKYIIDDYVIGDDIAFAVVERNVAVDEISKIIRRIINRSCESIDETSCDSIRDKYWRLEYAGLKKCEEEIDQLLVTMTAREARGSNIRVIAENILFRYRSMKAAIDQQILEKFETGQGVEELIIQRHELCDVFHEEISRKMERLRP